MVKSLGLKWKTLHKTIFLVCRTSKVQFYVLLDYFLMKQYCIFIHFFKRRCQRLKVKGQVERKKRIKLKVSNGRRWRWWNAWNLNIYKLQTSLFLKSFPSSGFWSLPISTCIFVLSDKNALILCNWGPQMACPFGLWMNAKLVYLTVNFAVRKGPTKEALSLYILTM